LHAAAACGLQPTSVSALSSRARMSSGTDPGQGCRSPTLLRRLRLGNAERSPQGREGACSQAPLPGNDRGNATSQSSFNTRTALEISNLNPQRESEPAPGRMLICTPLSAVVSPPAANPPRGAANRTGRSAAEPGRGTPAGADPGRRAGGPWLNIRLHPAAHPVLDSRWARCTLRAWSQHEGAAARCSATQSHRIPSAHARPPHTRFAARKHLTAESPARRLRMAPHPSLMCNGASTELPQAVVQRCNLRSCLGANNKPRAWFASSRHRKKPCCGSDSPP
jgi:hypothetical protein